jgi:hypothetical protein
MICRGAPVALAAALILLGLAPQALANPASSARYAAGASATIYSGPAFDTCTAPALSAISAWSASPYRALGVYIGGVDRSCLQPQLTAAWVTSVSALGWRLIPIYKGLQAPCGGSANKISAATASQQGASAADDAVTQATALGMISGSAVYYDMENYPTGNASCRTAVLRFLSGWTAEIHRQGYIAGVYAQLYSGAADLTGAYLSSSYARPDALWIARYDLNPALTGWTAIPDSDWSAQQRAKQYRGGHNETYGAVTVNIDNDQFNAPVATVAYAYQVSGAGVVRARSGPARSYQVLATHPDGSTLAVSCQAPGQRVGSTSLWDKLADGSSVPDAYVSTPSKTSYSPPLPRCAYPFQVTPAGGTNLRSGPGSSFSLAGKLAAGALAQVSCQRTGSKIGSSTVWDKLTNGYWVPDDHVSTVSKKSFSLPMPRC